MDEFLEELTRRFTYHPPKPDQPPMYEALRKQAMEFASLMVMLCPDSRELSLALTKLEEAIMWANAAIARRG